MSEPEDWHDAACRGKQPTWWFPSGETPAYLRHGMIGRARAVCERCPRLTDCLEWSLAQPAALGGVWATLTQLERDEELRWRAGRRGRATLCPICRVQFPALAIMRRHAIDQHRLPHRRVSHAVERMTG